MASLGQLGTGAYAGMEWGQTTDAQGSKINGWIPSGVKVGASGITDSQTGCGNHSGGGYIGEGMGAGGACLPGGGSPNGAGGSYSFPNGAGGGGGGSASDGGGGGLGGSPSLKGLQDAAGTNPTAVQSAPQGGIGLGPTMGGALDIPAPEQGLNAPSFGDANPTQQLTGPGGGRSGLGQRVPPSLAALLKYKVY